MDAGEFGYVQEGVAGDGHHAGASEIGGVFVCEVGLVCGEAVEIGAVAEEMFVADVAEDACFEKGVAEGEGFGLCTGVAFGDEEIYGVERREAACVAA